MHDNVSNLYIEAFHTNHFVEWSFAARYTVPLWRGQFSHKYWPSVRTKYVFFIQHLIDILPQFRQLFLQYLSTVYPKKYAHGFVVLCFVVVMQSFIMNSHEVFIHIHQGCFAGTGAIVRLPQCQWSKPDGYGKISQCITTTKHSKAKTVCIFIGLYCILIGIVLALDCMCIFMYIYPILIDTDDRSI